MGNIGNESPTLVHFIDIKLAERRESKQEFYDAIGITSAAFSQWKRGICRPKTGTMVRIAKHLDVPLKDLLSMGVSENDEKNPSTQEEDGKVVLTEDEKYMLGLFQQVPDDEKDKVIMAVEVALRSRGLLG